MNRVGVAGGILLVCLIFAFASQAIVRIKTTELSFQLSRDQIFNYELSSRMLRERFKSFLMQDDEYGREIKLNVLESGVLNFSDNDTIKLSPLEQAGLIIVNIVRRLNFKPFLSLEDDQQVLMLLQYAFLLERTRNYAEASEKYSALEERIKNSPQDHGFILLHNGFCLALLGRTDEALEKLKIPQELYPGSRSAEDARVLYRILLEAKEREERIRREYKTERAQAVALYKSGQFAAALKKFEKAEKLNIDDRYSKARSLEGVGRTKEAVGEYITLAEQSGNRDIAKKANRRLLMIGNFYRGGDKVKEIAQKNAEKIGDEAALTEINKGKELQLKPQVIEKIKQEAAKSAEEKSELDEELVEQLEELRQEIEETIESEEKEMAAVVTRAVEELPPEPEPPPPPPPPPKPVVKAPARLVVEFRDGRKISGIHLEGDADFLIVHSGEYSVKLPSLMLKGISLEEQTDNQSLLLVRFDNNKEVEGEALEFGDSEVVIIEDGDPETYEDVTVVEVRSVLK